MSDPKARRFFREVCKCVPRILKGYQLEEVTTRASITRIVADRIRQSKDVRSTDVIDTLVLKGRIELEEAMQGFMQRHHMITTYIRAPQQAARGAEKRAFLGQGKSKFMIDFLTSKAA